ncbi:hypothetical protein ACQY0O_002536 [Thecaphora frezii]
MSRVESPERLQHGASGSAPSTPPSQYRTATATFSAAFASLWGSYQQQHLEDAEAASRNVPGGHTETADASAISVASTSSGWGSLLSRGYGSQTISPSSPSRAGGRGRARGAIPFNISAPIEAGPADGSSRDSTLAAPPGTRQRALRNVFGQPDDVASEQPCTADATIASGTYIPSMESSGTVMLSAPHGAASAAYSTLSRLRTKPSRPSLRSGSGFLWGSGGTPSSDGVQTQKTAANWEEAIQKQERLDAHVRRVVFQAGLDYETRPMVVLAACCLPDPREVDYDDLFDRIISTMDLFAENDYTVIYLASGGRHRPGWNWLWKSYRRLGRKFRKNLKKLYIVHPTFFTRSLMQFIQTGAYFVSPKFPKKVTILQTLSELAQHVPLTQIDIPPEVLQVNATLEKSVTLPPPRNGSGDATASQVFGVELVQLMGEQGEKGGVPKVVRDCVEAILGTMGDAGIKPIEVEGIFRRSPSSALLRAAQESYDRGHPVSLQNYSDPHVPAVLLKVFLRSLPRPIFPSSLYPAISACPPPPCSANGAGNDDDDDDAADGKTQQAAAQETIQYLREVLLPSIEPPSAVILLSYVLNLLHRVSQHSDLNKMDAANLATVIAPNLVSSGNAMKDVALCKVDGIRSMHAAAAGSPTTRQTPKQQKKATTLGSIVRFCIEHYYEVFDEAEFGPRLERAQQLVDEISALPASASVMTFHSARSAHDGLPSPSSPSSPKHLRDGLPRPSEGLLHRRHGSATSSLSGLSGPNSPFNLAFTPSRAKLSPPALQGDSELPSAHQPKSITSREYRAPGTFGRSSAGSLRLTKRSLKMANGGGGGTNSLLPANGRDEELTGPLSSVALTGTSAAGYFSTSASHGWPPRRNSDGSDAETPSSPISLSPKASPTLGTSPVAASATSVTSNSSDDSAIASRRSAETRNQRQELSGVKEDGEA